MTYCPRCKNNHELIDISKKYFEIKFCKKCKGILFSKNDFKKLLELAQEINSIESFKDSDVETLKYTTQELPLLACPNCHYNLYKISNGTVELDYCNNCASIWFDKGELTAFTSQLRSGKKIVIDSSDLMDDDILNLIVAIANS